MSVQEVPQGRLRTPFYSRLAALDTLNNWHTWKGYTVPDALYCADTEYFAIRNSTGVFDLTPMTKYRITGPDALVYVDRLVTRDMRKIRPGRVAYAVWCNDQGQVIDDGTIFHLREGEYRLCSQERHAAWLMDSAIGLDVSITDETADVAALAVQGPTSFAILSRMGIEGLGDLKPFGLMHVEFDGFELTVSRTGFTGDLGYELWTAPENAESLWDYLFAAGEITGIRAIGTDALEHARIEAGYIAAYIDFLPAHATMRTGRTRSPLELGLDWLVDFKKPNFNGRRALAEEKRSGSTWRFVKLDIEGSLVARLQAEHRSRHGPDAARRSGVDALGGSLLPARDALVPHDGQGGGRRQTVLVPEAAQPHATGSRLGAPVSAPRSGPGPGQCGR
jgi:aminomethyltransferase